MWHAVTWALTRVGMGVAGDDAPGTTLACPRRSFLHGKPVADKPVISPSVSSLHSAWGMECRAGSVYIDGRPSRLRVPLSNAARSCRTTKTAQRRQPFLWRIEDEPKRESSPVCHRCDFCRIGTGVRRPGPGRGETSDPRREARADRRLPGLAHRYSRGGEGCGRRVSLRQLVSRRPGRGV